jgi:hypothetical protein
MKPIIIACGLFLILILAGCMAPQQALKQAAQQITTIYTTHTEEGLMGFSIDYPSDWTYYDPSSVTPIFLAAEKSEKASLQADFGTNDEIDTSDAAMLYDELKKEIAGSENEIIKEAEVKRINGKDWLAVCAIGDMKREIAPQDKVTYMCAYYGIYDKHDNHTIIIIRLEAGNAENLNEFMPVLEHAVLSFSFE